MAIETGEKQLAIIRQVECGVGDYGQAALWFSTFITESGAALQVFDWDQAREVIEAYGVRDVHQLEGKPCWVNASGSLIRWVGPAVFR